MILYSDNLVVLDYDPTTDILYVKWPDLKTFSMVEVEYSFKLLIQNLKSYDIKKLLIDSSGSNTDVDNPEYQALMTQLSIDLNTTRLEKIARVISQNPIREAQLNANTPRMEANVNSGLQYQNFENKEEAHAWLME